MSVTYRKIGGTTLAMYTEVADHIDALAAEVEACRAVIRSNSLRINELDPTSPAAAHLKTAEDSMRLRAETERLRGLLREARTRTQNLLNRQHGDAIIMNPDEYLRATLLLLDAALADQPDSNRREGEMSERPAGGAPNADSGSPPPSDQPEAVRNE